MEIFKMPVTSRWQITIPAKIRKMRNIKPGTNINFVVKGGFVTIENIDDINRLAGVFYNKGNKKISDHKLREIRTSGVVFEKPE